MIAKSFVRMLLLCTVLFSSCNSQTGNSSGEQSFCYWNTFYTLDTALWNQTTANHLYVRYFDVDWDAVTGEAKPIASITSNDSLPPNITPTVFLTNKVFEKSNEKALDSLSVRIKRRIDYITNDFGSNTYYGREKHYDGSINFDSIREVFLGEYQNRYKDILIDCDWTAGTKDKFFYFINRLKKDCESKDITVTLRLWQYKQTKTAGIPPVDRCLLMCYNMQTANNYEVENSIASMSELKKYVSGDKYPLKLDVALPIFSWAVLFRNEKFIGLLGNATEKSYTDNFIEYQTLGNGRYRSLVDKVVGDFFIRKGDIIRVEGISKDELLKMAEYLKKEIPTDEHSRVTFFSWNQSFIENYGTDEIKNIYSLFSK
ncbi:MAG: hypothetical protein LBN74_02090 [Prevotella sp.]|jgi:hypothetical protein|nr:hypothetical protein [Prevotella sp.]